MKCQSLLSGKHKKNISKRHLLKFLPRVLSITLQATCIKLRLIFLIYIFNFYILFANILRDFPTPLNYYGPFYLGNLTCKFTKLGNLDWKK